MKAQRGFTLIELMISAALMVVAYHYLGAPNVKFGSDAERVKGDFGASLVTVGLRYRFGG